MLSSIMSGYSSACTLTSQKTAAPVLSAPQRPLPPCRPCVLQYDLLGARPPLLVIIKLLRVQPLILIILSPLLPLVVFLLLLLALLTLPSFQILQRCKLQVRVIRCLLLPSLPQPAALCVLLPPPRVLLPPPYIPQASTAQLLKEGDQVVVALLRRQGVRPQDV